jgi:hypothetical protein
MLASDKHSSLLETLVNYGRKSCIKLGPSGQTVYLILYYFLSPSVSGRVQTLDLRIMSRVFYYCVTKTQPDFALNGWLLLLALTKLACSHWLKKIRCPKLDMTAVS